MLLKLIVLGAIFYGLYRLMGGKILPTPKEKKEERSDDKLEDTMVECEKCSTFVARREAIIYKGKFYCSAECLPKGGK
jgi:uncharacterized protein